MAASDAEPVFPLAPWRDGRRAAQADPGSPAPRRPLAPTFVEMGTLASRIWPPAAPLPAAAPPTCLIRWLM
jgi:hypothetical protein